MEDDKIQSLIESLKNLYGQHGEDFTDYLEGLKHQKYLDYWEYINLNTLLNLQQPRTNLKDEMVFIIYHQITELFFKLVIWELQQISHEVTPGKSFLYNRLSRINNYFRVLTQSFSIMREGMEEEQFTKFRMALIPASGFQSVQYRMIEIACTPLKNLIHRDHRERLKDASIEEQFSELYWKRGATQADTGEKTLTLSRFEAQYEDFLIYYARHWQGMTLWDKYYNLPEDIKEDEEIIKQMRQIDKFINVYWPKSHFKTAKHYLESEYSEKGEGTGGTNYQEYLPPQLQQRIFFPELWSEQEKAQWGKGNAHEET